MNFQGGLSKCGARPSPAAAMHLRMKQSMTYSRREMFKLSAVSLGAIALSQPDWLFADAGSPPAAAAPLRDLLSARMRDLVLAAQFRRGDIIFTRPCVDTTYRGTWPDDCVWPYIGNPELARLTEWPGLLQWLTDAVVDLPVVPDRVEFDDLAVLSPGGPNSSPESAQMPLHLPSAWTRYLDYAESFGAKIPRKAAWAQVIRRSFEHVPFSFGLVYSNPQVKIVGFGFHDTIPLTGLELMTSLVTYRGLQRAARLFAKEIEPAICAQWLQRAEGIRQNLYRLYDEKIGGFVGATNRGRQFSVWGNGLAYWLADKEQQRAILKFYRENQSRIFLRGCTRQVAEPGGWGDGAPNYAYQNGGYWATGTGFVLPTLADGDPELAARLAKELGDNLPAFDCAEWLDDKGNPNGARKFLASVSMPLIGTRSIAEHKPLLDYF